jgi:hypothetical protein
MTRLNFRLFFFFFVSFFLLLSYLIRWKVTTDRGGITNWRKRNEKKHTCPGSAAVIIVCARGENKIKKFQIPYDFFFFVKIIITRPSDERVRHRFTENRVPVLLPPLYAFYNSICI